MPLKLSRLLASCRRILLLLALCATLALAWVVWRAPSLENLRPELTALLSERLQLSELRMGRLSWRWAGQLWVQADDVSLSTRGGGVRLEHARLSVRISVWALLSGHVRPVGLRVRGGAIHLQWPSGLAGTTSAMLAGMPDMRFDIEDAALWLNLSREPWRIPGFRLHLDSATRRLVADAPGARLELTWGDSTQAVQLHVRLDNLRGLPPQVRRHVRGDMAGEWRVDGNPAAGEWRVRARLTAHGGKAVRLVEGGETLAFDRLAFRALVRGGDPLRPESITWEQVDWALDSQRLTARGEWKGGLLHARILDGAAALPLLARWSGRLATSGWRDWLARIDRGAVDHIAASLTLAQPSPWRAPDWHRTPRKDWRLEAELHRADAPLPEERGVVTGVDGHLIIDMRGFAVDVRHATLPEGAGRISGMLKLLDWKRPVLRLAGQGEVEVARLQRWLDLPAPDAWQWRLSPALARFSLRWAIPARGPGDGWVELSPDVAWEGALQGRVIRLSGGVLRWQADAARRSVAVRNMTIQYDTFAGRFDAAVREVDGRSWRLKSLRLRAGAPFPDLVRRWKLPVDGPRGEARATLSFDGDWRLSLDLTAAGWMRLLGAVKSPGEAWRLQATGTPDKDGVRIRRLASHGGFPRIRGGGRVDTRHALLDLARVRSPAFTGGIRVNLPFGFAGAPVEVDIRAEFLSRQALPEHMDFLEAAEAGGGRAGASARPWVLRGAVRRLQWEAATMHDVRVHFASSAQGVGTLEAARLDAANLQASRVHGYFRLPGKGVVDIRELTARLPGQNVRVSGVLTPEGGGRLRWRGFAVMQGEFSSVIRRLDASGLFRGGRMRAMWSGEGVLDRRQPWWHDLRGQLRLRSDEGRLLVESGTMTRLLAALNLLDLPRFLLGKRKDIRGEGLFYKRLQLEAHVENATAHVNSLAVRASALDMAGRGTVALDTGRIDLYATVRPLQNLDALLNMIPFLRDILLGPGGSVFRKVYHVHGPLQNARIDPADPKKAGLPGGGLIEELFTLPSRWFGKE